MSDEELAVEQDNALEEQKTELSDEEVKLAKLKEAITVESEEIGALRVKLTVTVPRETLDERSSDQFAELKREANIPGFRKGHAPLQLVEKRFGADVGEQLTNEIIGQAYLAAVEKEDLKPLGDPLFSVKIKQESRDGGGAEGPETEKLLSIEKALEHLSIPQEGPLSFRCELELKPEFEVPKLEKIPVEKPELSVMDTDVDNELKRMRLMRGTLRPVEKGKIEADDTLYADMTIAVDGAELASESNMELAARDLRINGILLVGLGEALVGHKAGDQVNFTAVVPDDYDGVDVRGKEAVFEFKILEVKRLELPPIDDEFLSTIGADSEDQLRQLIRSDLESQLDGILKQALHDQIGKYLVDNTKLEIPEGLSQRQVDRSLSRRRVSMLQAGMPEAEIDKSMDETRAKAQDQVARDLKLFFILEKIAEDSDIRVPEEHLNAAIAMIAQRSNKRFDRVRDELSKGEGLSTLYLQLRDRQILDDLLKDAEITEATAPKEASVKKTAGESAGAKKTTVKKTAVKASAKKKTKKKS